MKEIWKNIDGYDGKYQVSNLGNVKSYKNLKKELCKNGYLRVTLYKEGKAKRFLVHRLVANTFLENKSNKPQVNHIDGNKTNNQINNLEWVTSSENNKHAHKIGLNKGSYGMLGKKGQLNKKSKIILQYSLEGVFIKKWYGFYEIKRELNINISNIVACCKKRRTKAKGYIWKYEEGI